MLKDTVLHTETAHKRLMLFIYYTWPCDCEFKLKKIQINKNTAQYNNLQILF